jgi:hypothetical protein
MGTVPALPDLIAKVLAITARIFDVYATVEEVPASGSCGLTQYAVNITDCGGDLANSLAQLIYSLTQMGAQLISALSAVPA